MSELTWPPEATTALDTTSPTQTVIERCLAGEEGAYLLLYKQYAAMLYRLVYSLLQHREDAEEVVQDSFEYAFRTLHRYDPNKAAFKTWLYTIAVSRCRNKRRRKWLPTFGLDLAANRADTGQPTPDEVLALTEKQQQVWQALQELTPKLRETAVLRYYESLTYAEIGAILDIPTKTAESRMRLAHNVLREQLGGVVDS
ncbi:MAG: RNA polymerase sigma factor [Chloroflexota bacterium]